MRGHILLAALSSAILCCASGAAAAAEPGEDPFRVKVSGFVNAVPGGEDRGGAAAFGEAEIEVTPQLKLPTGTVIAARAVLNVNGSLRASGGGWRALVPELSAFTINRLGRFEIGQRAGFPQSLIGFTPSEIAFTAAEYGPDAGVRLDPDGRLPLALLPAALGNQIGQMTYLGYAARLYNDRSFKFIYLSPRFRNGLYGAVSYTPRSAVPAGFRLGGAPAAAPAARARDVIQAAIVWNRRSEAVDLSIGATWSHSVSTNATDPVPQARRTDSFSGGISATIQDRWAIGLSATYDAQSLRPSAAASSANPYGVVASLNYVDGPWVIGGYYQHAAAPDTTRIDARAVLDLAQLGMSYLADQNHDLLGAGSYTDVKLYAGLSIYGLRQSGRSFVSNTQSGMIALAGIRFSFF